MKTIFSARAANAERTVTGMPRYNVEADGMWATFSSVSDAFITPFQSLDDHEAWRDAEYGRSKIPLNTANKKTLKSAIFALSLNKDDDEIIKNLRYAGLIYDKGRDGNRDGT